MQIRRYLHKQIGHLHRLGQIRLRKSLPHQPRNRQLVLRFVPCSRSRQDAPQATLHLWRRLLFAGSKRRRAGLLQLGLRYERGGHRQSEWKYILEEKTQWWKIFITIIFRGIQRRDNDRASWAVMKRTAEQPVRALYCPLSRQKPALPNVNIILITFLPHFYGPRSRTNSSRPKLKSSSKHLHNFYLKKITAYLKIPTYVKKNQQRSMKNPKKKYLKKAPGWAGLSFCKLNPFWLQEPTGDSLYFHFHKFINSNIY